MFNLQSILGDRIQKKGLAKSVEAAMVCEMAQKLLTDIFPAEIAVQVKVISFKRGTLAIKTGASVIAQEIKLKQSAIIDQLNKKFDTAAVKNIQYLS